MPKQNSPHKEGLFCFVSFLRFSALRLRVSASFILVKMKLECRRNDIGDDVIVCSYGLRGGNLQAIINVKGVVSRGSI